MLGNDAAKLRNVSAFRSLPKVDVVRSNPRLEAFSASTRSFAARKAIAFARECVAAGSPMEYDAIVERAVSEANHLAKRTLRQAINASGVILHTGLGRARLADEAAQALYETALSHAFVELNEETGERGDRQAHVRTLICNLVQCDSALVVNNNAAAVVLTLAALCAGREVILSRGQMVEIGGSFRMPDIVRTSGCQLVEVGCTNKTHRADYLSAITENTAAILRCHPSNFRIVGFSQEVPLNELRAIASEHELLVIDDLGSGSMVNTAAYGLPQETTLKMALEQGADIAMASGDKLLGGPQCGIIVGRSDLIERISKHPLARAFRVDKFTLAALEATLRIYRDNNVERIPTLAAMLRTEVELKRVANRLSKACPKHSVVERAETEVGGGSAPGYGLPTWRVGIATPNAEQLLGYFRGYQPGIIGRIQYGKVWLDPRTISADEERFVISAIRKIPPEYLA